MTIERRSLLLPRKWKALFGFLGFSGMLTLATLLIGGGRAWNKWDAMQAQLTDIQKLQKDVRGLRGRIAELTTAENETRAKVGLPPLVHQSILDGSSDSHDHRSAPSPRESQQAVLPITPTVGDRGRHRG